MKLDTKTIREVRITNDEIRALLGVPPGSRLVDVVWLRDMSGPLFRFEEYLGGSYA
jgi:hypothetical protein